MPAPNEYRLPFEAPIYEMEARLAEMEALHAKNRGGRRRRRRRLAEQIRRLRRELAGLKRTIYANLDPWQTVQVSRHPRRPQTRDYLDLIFDQFVELHGDRAIGDDKAIVTGLAHLGDQKVMFVGHQKGKNLAERTACNFGCAHPEGYRKALRKMQMAAKFGLPIVSFIDTPGAYPGIAAEERGQAAIIAENLMAMSQIDTPIVCVVIGEGGSGGALGIGIGDRVAMLEHAYYSVISPEGCATILWKSQRARPQGRRGPEDDQPRPAAASASSTRSSPSPLGGAHRDHREAASILKSFLIRSLREIAEQPRAALLDRRYDKFRQIGVFEEGAIAEVPLPSANGTPGPSPGLDGRGRRHSRVGNRPAPGCHWLCRCPEPPGTGKAGGTRNHPEFDPIGRARIDS